MKKWIITTTSLSILVLAGGIYLAVPKGEAKVEEPTPAVQSAQQYDNTQPQQVEFVEQISEAPTPAPVQEAPAPTPAPAPAPETPAPVRSFDQIILDYSKMSGDALRTECSKRIEAGFPERFQEHNREHNVALVARIFSSSCSAIMKNGSPAQTRPFPYMEDVQGQGDFFVRFGGK